MNKDFFLALEKGDVRIIQTLFQQDTSVLSEVTFEGDTALHIAARKGDLDLVRWILRERSSLAVARNKDQNTPLHEAARTRRPNVVRIILEINTSCAASLNKFGETVLIIASKYAHEESVKQFLEATYQGGTIYHLHAAVQGGSLGIVKAILNHRADDRAWHNKLMTEEDKCGRYAIHVAAMKGNWDIIAEFISRMPDSVEILCLDHKSVLHFGVEYNRTKVVENLLEGKEKEELADRVSRDCDLCQNTALHLAAKNRVDSEV